MKRMDQKEGLDALRKAGFNTLEIERLFQLRRTYTEQEMDQAPAVLSPTVYPVARHEWKAVRTD